MQMLPCRLRSYIRDPWNIADQIMYGILLAAVILRFTLTGDSFVYARYVYTVDLILFYLRILQLYYVNKRLGPKVVVIGRMVCLQCALSFCMLHGLFIYSTFYRLVKTFSNTSQHLTAH